jgi:membrane protein
LTSLAKLPVDELISRAPGRDATSPWALPWAAWKQVLARSWKEANDDNMSLIAAGVAFYGFLALVPLLGSLVLLYGLIADAATVLHDIGALAQVLPAYAAKFIAHQLVEIVTASTGKKGLGLLVALALALFGARNAAGSIVTALNIAYEEAETRGFIKLNLLAIAITTAGVLIAVVAVVAIAALGHLEGMLPQMPDWLLAIGKILSYLLMALGGAAGAATLYRYGPARAEARWIWLTPGSLGAALTWLLLSLGFGVYVANVDDYSATYGSLSAIVVVLTWLYLSSYILLFGAELNSELEHQTMRDSTSGAERPIGERGAWVADHVAGEDPQENDGRASPVSDAPAETSLPSAEKPRSVPAEYVTIRTTARVGRLAKVARIGMLPSILAATGLSMLRRRGKGAAGAAALGAAGALAWLSRDRPGDG